MVALRVASHDKGELHRSSPEVRNMKSGNVVKTGRCACIAVRHQQRRPPVYLDGAADEVFALRAGERVRVPTVVDGKLERLALVNTKHRVGTGGLDGREIRRDSETDSFGDRHARPAGRVLVAITGPRCRLAPCAEDSQRQTDKEHTTPDCPSSNHLSSEALDAGLARALRNKSSVFAKSISQKDLHTACSFLPL